MRLYTTARLLLLTQLLNVIAILDEVKAARFTFVDSNLRETDQFLQNGVGNRNTAVECAVLCARNSLCNSFLVEQSVNSSPQNRCVLFSNKDDNGDVLQVPVINFNVRLWAPVILVEQCHSRDNVRRECSYLSPVTQIISRHKQSIAACDSGVNYGITESGDIWVDNGCRATFTFQIN